MNRPGTLAELREAGVTTRSIRTELRSNLIDRIRSGEGIFPGIIGFDQSVLPQIENAVLSGQDMVLLGERGQAKTRLMRSLTRLLDDEIPAVAGCELRDDPFDPICEHCKRTIEKMGPDTPIQWVSRDLRYTEKLATPDVTVADLIGEVDPIKVAEGRYLSDVSTIHYGLVPRSNRGIFAFNELPDLAEKIQVGLFNVLEERDVQIRGFTVRLPLDIFFVASANPEDYTNRGRIITPLKDRFGSCIRTHYPESREEEIIIIDQERRPFPEEDEVHVPSYMKEIIAEISRKARNHPEIDQRSGVSVRASIHNMENLLSNAFRRSLKFSSERAVPRISDLAYLKASLLGKIEFEGFGEQPEDKVISEVLDQAVREVFESYRRNEDFKTFLANFEDSREVLVSADWSGSQYEKQAGSLEGAEEVFALAEGSGPEERASALEFVLEGLRLRGQLGKDEIAGTVHYHRSRD